MEQRQRVGGVGVGGEARDSGKFTGGKNPVGKDMGFFQCTFHLYTIGPFVEMIRTVPQADCYALEAGEQRRQKQETAVFGRFILIDITNVEQENKFNRDCEGARHRRRPVPC